jgi:F-type H+-transporting ATPase subunit b
MMYLLAAEEGHAIHFLTPSPENLKAALWTLGIFVALLFVLRKYAWGPIITGLNARETRISESLKKAEELEKATRELAETNRRAMEKAQQEALAIVAESRGAAARAADEQLVKAQAEIDAQRDRARREIQLETEKARDQLRRDVVDLTIQATARLIGKSLSDPDQRRLAEEALRDAESVTRN